MKIFVVLLSSLMLFCLGCQTNEVKQFEKLKVGMDKDEVLNVMGSPRHTERRQGRDRWTYEFYQDTKQNFKEVQFQEGKSTYLGEVTQPEVSAVDQDKLNEESNIALEKRWTQEREEYKKRSAEYFNDSKANSEIRYSPRFDPIQ